MIIISMMPISMTCAEMAECYTDLYHAWDQLCSMPDGLHSLEGYYPPIPVDSTVSCTLKWLCCATHVSYSWQKAMT